MNHGIGSQHRLLPLRFGPIVCLIGREEAFVYYATYIVGEYDFLNIHKGDIVLDAGANVGDFALKAALRVGNAGQVIAIEPAAESYSILQRNILVNGFQNIICKKKALWDQETVVYLQEFGASSRVGENNLFRGTHVEATTIDALIKELALDHIDIVKMDIEGAEVNALKDQKSLRKVRQIAVEIHGIENRKRLLEILRKKGFSTKTFTNVDLIRNVLTNLIRHLPDFFKAELKTRFFALKYLLTTLLNLGAPSIPPCNTRSGLCIIYGQREAKKDASPNVGDS